ncbi:MAG: Inner membrane amino-acid ABC transporter permease protein YhdY [Arcobacter lacus]|jgi:general L-amino acid transport system permease protein|nr:MAG: Inner membrane amino-acid ABC transporter permease protein YhdY [Arcobacter lacus]
MATYEIKEAKPAPKDLSGPIRWVKENLLATPLDIVLTILGLAVLLMIIPPFVQWAIIDANFVGTTREACTDGGACWVFIKEKITLFIYGFYPESEYWRINLSFALFFVFGALFKYFGQSFITKIAVFTGYPVLVYFLVSGGYFGLETVTTDKWGGLTLTLIVAAVGIVAAFPIGIVLAFGRQSKLPIIKNLSIVYIEFIRGVPLITILFMASVILPLFFPEGMTFDKLLRALIGITLFQAAYIAEVIRGGLQAIPKGQYEAADSLGLSYWQKMLLVILPQALKVSIPNLVGASISLFKDTTLVLIIGLFDLLAMVHLTGSDAAWLGYETEGYVFVTFIFWIFCFSLSKYSNILEKRYNTDHR